MTSDSSSGGPGNASPSPGPFWLRLLVRLLLWTGGLALALVVCAVTVAGVALSVAYPNLPDLSELTDYRPKLPLRVYSADGVLIGEFGEERRNLTPINEIPKVMKDAVSRARNGEGPTFVESLTYRMGPHSSSDDPTRYRSNDEVEAWAKKDPILRFERYLRRAELLDDAKKESIEEALRSEFEAAVAAVEELGPPSRESLFEDTYGGALPPHLREQQAELLANEPAPTAHH